MTCFCLVLASSTRARSGSGRVVYGPGGRHVGHRHQGHGGRGARRQGRASQVGCNIPPYVTHIS